VTGAISSAWKHPDYAGPPGVIPLRVLENTKSFSIFGDLSYCSLDQSGSWELELSAVGMETAQLLNWTSRLSRVGRTDRAQLGRSDR
jgi:hypothetical protein